MRRSKRRIACSGFFFAEAPSPLNPSAFFSVYVYVLFSFRRKKREPEKKAGNMPRKQPLLSPVSGTCLPCKKHFAGLFFFFLPFFFFL